MAWIVRLVSLGAEGKEYSTDVLQIARPGDITGLATWGLTVAESKRVLASVHQEIVAEQGCAYGARVGILFQSVSVPGVRDLSVPQSPF